MKNSQQKEIVNVDLSKREEEALRCMAQELGISMDALVERIVERYLDGMEAAVGAAPGPALGSVGAVAQKGSKQPTAPKHGAAGKRQQGNQADRNGKDRKVKDVVLLGRVESIGAKTASVPSQAASVKRAPVRSIPVVSQALTDEELLDLTTGKAGHWKLEPMLIDIGVLKWSHAKCQEVAKIWERWAIQLRLLGSPHCVGKNGRQVYQLQHRLERQAPVMN